MCGRFTLKTPAASWVEQLFAGIRFLDLPELPPRYNIAPTQPILAVFQPSESPEYRAATFRWGLIPSWAEDLSIGNKMINARGETVAEKPSFRKAFASQRCLIVADGYYEWQKVNAKVKRPFWIHRPQELPFLMAGLWEINRRISRTEPIFSTTVLTTSANAKTAPVHDRMPVIIDPADVADWLDPKNQATDRVQQLVRAPDDDYFELTEVSSTVNNPRNEGAVCLEPITSTQEGLT